MPHLGLGLDLGGRRAMGSKPLAPTLVTSQFIVDTILGKVDFTDNSNGTAQHEVYSNTNAAGDVLLTTLNAGIVTYNDTTCKQNASVVYKVRAKKGSIYSTYATASALATPLCWKTNQATRTNVMINFLHITAGKTVNVDWGDGTNANYTGSNSYITKTYDASAINVFNIKLSGDTNSITTFQHFNQIKSYGAVTNWVLPSTLTNFAVYSTGLTGVVTNWVLPSTLTYFAVYSTGLTGVVTNWVLPSTLTYFNINSIGLTGVVTNWVLPSTLAAFYIYSTGLTGSLPQITTHATNALIYQAQSSSISDSVVTVFRKAMTVFNISNQNVAFSTVNIDKVLKALADWYQVNAPTANCTFTMNGVNMGIPTGGANNVDLLRLAQYYANASKTATIIISS